MNQFKQISLFITVVLWATLIGAIMYSHVVFLSAYLPNLPESTQLIQGPFGLVDERFWKAIHPILLPSLLVTAGLNWNVQHKRKFIMTAVVIYLAVLVITFLYFVPELMEFAKSAQSSIPAEEWKARGIRWEQLSWIRGAFMYAGFVSLLIALAKNPVIVTSRTTQRKRGMVNA